jgi:pSer/pThr/pTyr-binding forkhead associated (FHA) protein
MPKLILKRKAEVIDEFNMKSSQSSCTIGSDKFNNIVINDKQVSMTHASIERRAKGYFVRDLNSAFGTFLNGKKVEDIAALKNGDIVQAGNHAIIFDNDVEWTDADGERPTPDSVEEFAEGEISADVQIDSVKSTVHQILKEDVQTASSKKTNGVEWAPYYLLAIYGPYKGKRYQLRFGETKIGRDENLNDILLQKTPNGDADQSISRRHATVFHENGSFFVRDKRSKTRTHVNQIIVPVDEDVEVFSGDEIEIVSDQQSTIFRLVEESRFDFSAPRRAGVWWVRYQSHLKKGIAALAVILGASLMVNGLLERNMLTQKPDPFTVELAQWGPDEMGGDPNGNLPTTVPPPVLAADYNRDGFVDIITTNISNKPLLIDGETKLPKWIIDTVPADPRSPFVSADINQDEVADLLFVSSDNRLAAIDGLYGAEIWLSPFAGVRLIGPAVVEDFDGDDLNDVAIANSEGVVHVGYNRVSDMDWFSVATEIPLQCPLASADINGDGRPELVAGSERGLVLIIDSQERNITSSIDVNEELNRARGTFFEDNQIRYPVGVNDLNNDQQPDYVIMTMQGRIIAINGATKGRLWFDVFTDELTSSEGLMLPFAFGYFDDDLVLDVAARTNFGKVRAYAGAGEEQQSQVLWEVSVNDPTGSGNDLIAVDVNKDGITDVVFTEKTGVLKILDGRTGADLTPLGVAIPPGVSAPVIADLSHDGRLDLVVVKQDGLVYQFMSNSLIPEAAILWGQRFGHSNHRLVQTSQLPPTLQADISTVAGLLMFLGTGIATFFSQRRHRRRDDR